MGDGRAEGWSTIRPGAAGGGGAGADAMSLMPDADGTGIGSLLDSIHSHLGKFAT